MAALQLLRITGAINDDLWKAVAAFEMFVPSGRDQALIARVNAGQFHPGFNVISDALHQKTVLALCRLWDNRTRGTAGIVEASRRLSKKTVVAAVEARRGSPLDSAELAKWLDTVRHIEGSDQLSALKRTRSRQLAHTADPSVIYEGPAREAVYGDERFVLEASIPISIQLNGFVGQPHGGVKDIRRFWAARASLFWDHLAPPLMEHE